MNEKNLIFAYELAVFYDQSKIKVENIEHIYSPFFDEDVFVVLNPERDLAFLKNKAVGIGFIVNGNNITQWVDILAIEKFNNSYVLRYVDIDEDHKNPFSFAKDLYLHHDRKQKIWKGFNALQKDQYQYVTLHTVPWQRSHYPKHIIIDGNEIDGCNDFACELGFLLNFNQWGYFGGSPSALADCLSSLPKDTKIIWKNYNRSRILIDASYRSSAGTAICFPSSNDESYSEIVCKTLGEFIDFERID